MIPPEIASTLASLGALGVVFAWMYFAERKRNTEIQEARLRETNALQEARIKELKEHLQFVVDQLCNDNPLPPKRPVYPPPDQQAHMQ